MRDIAFLAIGAILLFLAFKRPFVGVALWAWSGLFVPNHWLYGIAQSISFNTLFAAAAIISLVFSSSKAGWRWDSRFVLALLFFACTTVSSAFTLGLPELVWSQWEKFAKVMMLFVMICLVIRRRSQFNLLVWVLALSIGFFGVVEGLKFLASGGGHKIHGPQGHILSDNNHLAISLASLLPLFIYLAGEQSDKILKYVIYAGTAVAVLSILGSYSRGGLISLMIVGGYFWLKSSKKLLSATAFLFIAVIASFYLPEQWFARAQSLEDISQQGTFLSRVVSWKIHALMALERPFVGGGFNAPAYGHIWRGLSENIYLFDFFATPEPSYRGWAAHSIYFQVLGDNGFPGFFFFISVLISCFFRLGKIEKLVTKLHGTDHWQFRLARMTKVSIVCFSVGGASVSLAYLELLWILVAFVVSQSIAIKLQEERHLAVETKQFVAGRGNRPLGLSGADIHQLPQKVRSDRY